MEKLKKIMKLLFIVILSFMYSCHHTNSYKDSLNEKIISFYENKKEISNKNIKSLRSNFKGLSKINDIITNANFRDNNGIYIVRLNISHTTSTLLLVNNKNYIILPLEGNSNQILDDFTVKAKNMELYEKKHREDYEKNIIKILEDNNKIINSMTLKPLE